MARTKKGPPPDDARIQVRLKLELHSRLKSVAALDRKELAEALDEAVCDYLKRHEPKKPGA